MTALFEARAVSFGAGNPVLARDALKLENEVGTMLLRNVAIHDAPFSTGAKARAASAAEAAGRAGQQERIASCRRLALRSTSESHAGPHGDLEEPLASGLERTSYDRLAIVAPPTLSRHFQSGADV